MIEQIQALIEQHIDTQELRVAFVVDHVPPPRRKRPHATAPQARRRQGSGPAQARVQAPADRSFPRKHADRRVRLSSNRSSSRTFRGKG